MVTLIVKLLVGSVLSSGMLVLLISLFKALFRNQMSARWHYLIWFFLIIRLAVPYTPISPIHLSDYLFHSPAQSQSSKISEAGSMTDSPIKTNPQSLKDTDAIDFIPASTAKNDDMIDSGYAGKAINEWLQQPVIKGEEITRSGLIFILWLAGVLVLSLYAVVTNLLFWSRVKDGSLFTDNAVLSLLEESKEKLDVRTSVSVVMADRVSIPAIFGVMRPWLLIPEKVLKQMSPEKLRYVVLHELAHLKRKDILVNWITLVLRILYWFNPLVWYAFHQMRIDRELACDEHVLEILEQGEAKAYGYTLLDMVEILSGRVSYAGIAGVLEDKSQIAERILKISTFNRLRKSYALLNIMILMLLGGSLLVNAVQWPSPGVEQMAYEAEAVSKPANPSTLTEQPEEPLTTEIEQPLVAVREDPFVTVPEEGVEIYRGSFGAIEKLEGATGFLRQDENDIRVLSIEPQLGLTAEVETELTIVLAYNLVSREEAVLAVCANVGGYRATSENAMEVSVLTVSRGQGMYRFKVPVVPKKWEDGTPFWVLGKLGEANGPNLCNTQPVPLALE